MKNLTKIFMAVVALFAVACTTDTTGDLAPELGLGEGQQTTLTLSLEESRTYLGEKAGEIYPLYWSENDVIAVNGTASTGISILEETEAAARFSFGENTVSRPFHVIYPAPAEGVETVTEGCYPVVFPATQVYAEGTFAAGTAPMYGYAAAPAEGEEAAPIQMQHLTGILRLAVKGDVTLSTLVIKAESGSLSGTYDVNCESGALTAQEGSTSDTVTVSFDGGLALKADEATPIYVAVPAGSYGAVRAILTTTEDKKMTIKFDSDSKPIAKATVREFTEFTFVENALDGDVFEIYDVEDMLMFAKTATSFPWSEAKLMATVDMAGVEWTPVDGFSKIFNGNYSEATPYEIKNLSAPLFGTTTATIKNVKLTDVNINIAQAASSNGALVRVFNGGTIENCEVSGSMTINGGGYSYGGIVGAIKGASTFTNVTNRCNVTVTVNNNTNVYVGGIAGYVNKKLTINTCNNHGAVTISGTDTNETRIGGIIGYLAEGGETTADGINNYGGVTVTHAQGGTSHIAGIFGSVFAKSTLDNSSNGAGGKVFVKGTSGGTSTGGLVGYASSAIDLDTCENCDSIKINVTIQNQSMLGGLVGYYQTSEAKSIKNSTNNGVVYADGSHTVSNNCHCRVGGFVGYSSANTTIEDSTNNGNVYVTGTAKSGYAAGFCGFATGNTGTRLTNTADITYAGTAHTEQLFIGGCYARLDSTNTLSDLTNAPAETATADDSSEDAPSAKIVVTEDATIKGVIYAGGVVGYIKSTTTLTNATNKGAMDIKGATSSDYYAGGVVGYTANTITTAENHGTLDIGGSAKGNYYVGGVVGRAVKAVSGLTNYTTVTFGGTSTGYYAAGGVIGYADAAATGLTNEGAVTIADVTSGDYLYFGGVVGWNVSELTTASNSGTITLGGSSKKIYQVGGVVGLSHGKITTATNSGTLNFGGTSSSAYCAGGVVGYLANDSCTGLTNESTGTLTVSGSATTYCAVGGVVGQADKAVSGATNKAAVTFGGTATTYYAAGGVVGYAVASVGSSTNNGTVTFGGTAGSYYAAGGVVGEAKGALTSLTNESTGALTFNATATACHNVGGVVGRTTGVDLTTLENKAALTYSGHTTTGLNVNGDQDNICVGGVAGAIVGTAETFNNVKDLTNSGLVTLSDFKANSGMLMLKHCRYYFGGVIGYSLNCNLDNCDNTATEFKQEESAVITIYSNSSAKNTHAIILGGVAGVVSSGSTMKNCDNSAKLNLNAPNGSVPEIHHYIGGLVGGSDVGSIESCTNSGALAFAPTFNSKRFNMGGIVGWYQGTGVKSCTNNGAISYAPTILKTNHLRVGGIVGYNIGTSKIDACINNGHISLGSRCSNNEGCYIGGVVGYTGATTKCVSSENYGNIFTKDTFCTNANACVGGIVGTAGAGAEIKDSKVFCCISVGEFSSGTPYTNVGFVLGRTRTDTIKATNCSIGGFILEYENPDDPYSAVTRLPVFDFSDYMYYIYGGETDWTNVTPLYDDCGYLATKDSEPQKPTPEVTTPEEPTTPEVTTPEGAE